MYFKGKDMENLASDAGQYLKTVAYPNFASQSCACPRFDQDTLKVSIPSTTFEFIVEAFLFFRCLTELPLGMTVFYHTAPAKQL